jgi:hypothetical protein
MLETYTQLRADGIPTPQVVLLLALDNGPSEPLACLNEEIAWIADNYLTTFAADLWVQYLGSPLLTILDGAGLYTGNVWQMSLLSNTFVLFALNQSYHHSPHWWRRSLRFDG